MDKVFFIWSGLDLKYHKYCTGIPEMDRSSDIKIAEEYGRIT